MKKILLAAAILGLVSCKKEMTVDSEINRVFINARCENCTVKYSSDGNLYTQAAVNGALDATIMAKSGTAVNVTMWSEKKTEMVLSVSTNDEKTNYLNSVSYKPGEIFYNSVIVK